MNVIITMAGLGSRFRKVGYTVPKYQIEVRGRTLFSWSMESLRNFARVGARFVFVTRAEDRAGDFLYSQCARLGLNVGAVVELDAITDGQATTVLKAAPALPDAGEPFLIYNIDTYVEPHALPAEAVRGMGWIPCFPGPGSAWSFARTDACGKVLEVREKERISPHATIGLYYFDSFDLYADVYRAYYTTEAHVEKGERYVAPLYNELVRRGLSVYMHSVPLKSVHALGTPEEVEAFLHAGQAGGSHTYV